MSGASLGLLSRVADPARSPSISGAFRALNDLGLLDRLQVISSVSGGSVICGDVRLLE